MTDANGKVLYRQSYTPFGERTLQGFVYNSTATRFGFTSREHTVGPYMYYRARHYDASTGRFLQADTYEGTEASPPSLNRYSYAYNNPVRYTDPGGRFPLDPSLDEYFDRAIDTISVLASYLALLGIASNPDVNLLARVFASLHREIEFLLLGLSFGAAVVRILLDEISGKSPPIVAIFSILVAGMMAALAQGIGDSIIDALPAFDPRLAALFLSSMLLTAQINLVIWRIDEQIEDYLFHR